MPDAMLFRAHVLSSLCDLQLQHEFGEEPLPIDSLSRLEDLRKILRMTLHPEVRHPWPQSARLRGPSRRIALAKSRRRVSGGPRLR